MTNIKFLHIADIHLGKRQYNLKERYYDYFRVFKSILEKSIEKEVDFILISGDLFDNRKIGPIVLTDVFNIISKFKERAKNKLNRDIPLICIEGNHDNPIYSTQSWMTFLADLELIILLSGKYDKNTKKIIFDPYDSKTRRGGKIKIKNITIYGLPFFGSSTAHIFPQIYDAIEQNNEQSNILMMHFGIQGNDPIKSGIEISESLNKLREKIDYLALGHFHKQYILPKKDPWIFNPGSLEINDIKELFENYERGAFIVKILGKEIYHEELICEIGDNNSNMISNRNFKLLSPIDIGETKSFKETIVLILDSLIKDLPEKKSNLSKSKDDLNCPIVIFSIKGQIPYSRLEVNINQLKGEIMNKFSILDVRIFSTYLISTLDDIIISEEKKTIEEIETDVFNAILSENPLFKGIESDTIALMKNIKFGLIEKSPNYFEIKESIKDWFMSYVDKFDLPKINIFTKSKKIKEESSEENNEEEIEENIQDEFDLDEYIDDIDN
ncbi:MAG: DNA repair exonuclease [Candidatus Lokiarchaeota archaeon]|nr:DNA repair exonuclease [Candidatus Lokiarchaeota archaeon]